MDSTYDELNHVLGRQRSENGDYFDPSTFVLVQQVEASNGGGTMATISGVAGQEGVMAAISPAVAEQQQESSNCFGGTTSAPISPVPQQYEDSSICFGGETAAMSAVSQQEKVTDDRFGGTTRGSAMPAFFSSAPQQEQVTDDPFGDAMTNASAIQQEASYQCFPGAIASTSVIPQQEIGSDDVFGGTAASNHCFGGATASIFTIPQRQQPPPQQVAMYDGFGGSTMTNIIPAVPAQEAVPNHCFQSPMATASPIPQQQGGTDDRSRGATTAEIFEVSDGEAAAAANDDDMSSTSWLEEILQDDTTEQQHNLAFDAQNQELPVGIFEFQ